MDYDMDTETALQLNHDRDLRRQARRNRQRRRQRLWFAAAAMLIAAGVIAHDFKVW